MTDESDNREDEEDRATPYGDGLWEDVRFWFDAILSAFGDLKELMVVGLTRSLAVKLCNWLWGVEGAVRRLIIAEALKRDPASLARTRSTTRPKPETAPGGPRRPHKRRPAFRIFGFIRPDEVAASHPSAIGPAPRPDLPAFWHIPFPSDPLLAIGRRPTKKRRRSCARRANPLDRRGLSRSDPDCWLWREEEDYDRLLLGGRPGFQEAERPSRPRPQPTPAQEKLGYLFFGADSSDWRRVEEEWKRVIPAPHLAARVFALSRVMENREAAVARVARLFQRSRDLAADIVGQPPPELAWPRRAKLIYRCREVEAMARKSHARLRRHDTS